jgi:hypothetical protein
MAMAGYWRRLAWIRVWRGIGFVWLGAKAVSRLTSFLALSGKVRPHAPELRAPRPIPVFPAGGPRSSRRARLRARRAMVGSSRPFHQPGGQGQHGALSDAGGVADILGSKLNRHGYASDPFGETRGRFAGIPAAQATLRRAVRLGADGARCRNLARRCYGPHAVSVHPP